MNALKSDSLLEMARGAIIERVDHEAMKVYENIKDPNTDPGKTRKITVELKFTADDDRESVKMSISVKSALAPTEPLGTRLYMVEGEQSPMIVEAARQMPGQIDMDGTEEEEPKILQLARKA